MLCAVHTKKEQLHCGNIISFSLWVAIFTRCRFVVHTTCIVLHQWTISDTWTTKHIFVIIFSYLLLLFIIWCDMHLTATAVALNIPSDTMSRSHSACRATLGYSLHHHSWKCYLSDCETYISIEAPGSIAVHSSFHIMTDERCSKLYSSKVMYWRFNTLSYFWLSRDIFGGENKGGEDWLFQYHGHSNAIQTCPKTRNSFMGRFIKWRGEGNSPKLLKICITLCSTGVSISLVAAFLLGIVRAVGSHFGIKFKHSFNHTFKMSWISLPV